MAKFITTIRNNWKKSVFGSVAVVYGINYAQDKYKVEKLMRSYCEEAARYGDVPVPPTLKPRSITVILNPAANRRKAKSNFEKYSAPLLHLAGYTVSVVHTESEGHARTLAAELTKADVIVVAGGDGTLSETVTGLMRIYGKVDRPIGVVPLGRTNATAFALLGEHKEGTATPADIAAATMAIVQGQSKAVDTMKVEVIQADGQEPPKPVYSLSGIRWGVYHDALSSQDRYWYFGVLRGYAAVLFNSLNISPVTAHVTYMHACDGCNSCFKSRVDLQRPSQNYRWYHYLLPSFSRGQQVPEVQVVDYQKVLNPDCGKVSDVDLTGVEVNVFAPCVCPGGCGVHVSAGPSSISWSEYLAEGCRRVKGERPTSTQYLQAQHLEIVPVMNLKEGEERWFSVDNEEYEVRPIRITLIPKLVQVFYPKQDQTSYTLLEKALLGCC